MSRLRILAVGDPAVYGYIEPSFKIIENYEINEGVKIDFHIVDFKSYYQELMSTFSSYAYDIVMIAGHLWLPEMVEKGYLKAFKFESDPDIILSIQQEMTYKNQTYLMPSFCDGHLLVYRQSLVKHKIGPKISVKDLIMNVHANYHHPKIALKAHPSELFLDVLPYVRSFHGPLFDSNNKLNLKGEKMLDGIKAYQQMLSLAPKETQTFGNEEILKQIQLKKVPYAVTWGGQLGRIYTEDCIEKNDLGFAQLVESWNVTWSFAIPHNTPQAEKAFDFMTYLISPQVDRKIGAFCGSPIRRSTYKLDGGKYPWYKPLLQMLEEAKRLPNHPYLGSIIGALTELYLDYLNQRIDDNEYIKQIELINERW